MFYNVSEMFICISYIRSGDGIYLYSTFSIYAYITQTIKR
jgi:sortase (surface protein transpeptidase)